MTNKEIAIVRQAAKILRKTEMAKGCKSFCWGCFQCYGANLIKLFNGFVDDLESDEEMELFFKTLEKKK